MKYFFLDSRIDEVLLNKFFVFANDNMDYDWTITIWSTGGMTGMAKTILYIINSRKERVTLICNEAYSAAFEIFYFSDCKKVITKECKGCVHYSASDIRLMRNGKTNDAEHACILRNWQEDKNSTKWVRKVLTKEENKKFNLGEDIYFTTKRMKEIFPNAEVI